MSLSLIIRLISQYALYIYIACALGMLLYLRAALAARQEGFSKNTFQFYYYTLNPFTGYPLSIDGANSYLKSLKCGNGEARAHQALKTLLLWLYHQGCTQDKIIDKVPVPRTQKRILPVVSEQHLEVLSKHCQCERDKVLINFLWHSGVRLSEAAKKSRSL